ncbi:MAG TPA: hypothetical protein VJA21_14305 [Verrucomicrobiae bacterium]
MKKLLLSVVVAAFAVAVQAGDNGTCAEKAGSCCPMKQSATAAKAECPMAKKAKITKGAKQATAKQALKSPKATG